MKANKNKPNYGRSGSIKVFTPEGISESVNVWQEGKKASYWRVKDFYHTFGLGFGYVEKIWNYSDDGSKWGIFEQNSPVQGVWAGLRYDPYFAPRIFGLGISTGLYYECYSRTAAGQNGYNYTFNEHAFSAPVHLNYRIDFDEGGIFGIFVHCGLNFDLGVAASLQNDDGYVVKKDNLYKGGLNRYNISFGYGGGLHIHRVLLDFTTTKGLINHSKDDAYRLTQNTLYKLSITIMFNYPPKKTK